MQDYRFGRWTVNGWSKLATAAGSTCKNTIDLPQRQAAYTDKATFRIGTTECRLGIDARLEISHVFHLSESGNWTSWAISSAC